MPLMLLVSREERLLKLFLCRGHLIGAETGLRKGGTHGTHWQRGSLSQRSSTLIRGNNVCKERTAVPELRVPP